MLEEMPAFPDRKSSLLNKLYETAPWTAKLHQQEQGAGSGEAAGESMESMEPSPVVNEPIINIGLSVDPLISTTSNNIVVVGVVIFGHTKSITVNPQNMGF